uniref:Uncharacterized protein n=1 Tax=Mola mola TaxID=94237 RepID=A0A3Q3X0Z0_MOLML
MDSSGMLRGLLCVTCHDHMSQEVDEPEPADRDLVEALEVLLGRMDNQVSFPEKRGNNLLCGLGDRCAMKLGPRIGKLCDCGRGANCNSYLLECI